MPLKQTFEREFRDLRLRMLRRRLRCVFVLSTGRCGTQTLAHVLDASPDLLACHEPKPHFLKATRAAYDQATVPVRFRDSFTYQYLRQRYVDHRANAPLRAAVHQRLWFAECANRLTYAAADLARYLPQSRFILLHRDPAAVIRSGMRRGYYQHHAWDRHRIVPHPDDPAAREWPTWNAFQRTCWYWQAVNGIALHLINELPPDRSYRLASADLFDADSPALSGLFEWLGIQSPSAQELHQRLKSPLNAQQQGAFPPPAEWSDAQWSDLERIAGPVMAALGYSH